MSEYLKNPFNYTGAKYKLLPQILPLFPYGIDTFIDMFGGSGEVSLNVDANMVLYYDKSEAMVNIFKNLDNDFLVQVDDTIKRWNLSKLGKEEYITFRKYYNENFCLMTDRERAVSIYCLLTHAFNYQIAFNSVGEYNMPSGYNRSYYSPQLKQKLTAYINEIQDREIYFRYSDFTNIDFSSYDKDTFFYADPPYLITYGAYERDYSTKWNEGYERKLLAFLDNLNANGYKFALSNVLEHKGKSNDILKKWSSQYYVHHLSMEYSNCNYQTNMSEDKTSDEVLITNYLNN